MILKAELTSNLCAGCSVPVSEHTLASGACMEDSNENGGIFLVGFFLRVNILNLIKSIAAGYNIY